MWGVLLVGLLIMLGKLLVAYWPVVLFILAVFALGYWLCRSPSAAAQREAREVLRHEQARREIDRITLETSRAMYDAATRHADVIEGTAVEIERR